MLSSRNIAPSSTSHLDLEDDHLIPHSIRHISSIQVRNLTPFPIRDTFASALTQPSEQSQFTSHGHLSDDLDVTLGRRRGRKVSTGSVSSVAAFRREVESGSPDAQRPAEGSLRRRASSRASVSSSFNPSASVGSKAGRRATASTPTVRPPYRTRTASAASSTSSWHGSPQTRDNAGIANTSKVPLFLPDVSQAGLENVVHSRLVETFLSITLPVSGSESSPTFPNGSHRDNTGSPTTPSSPHSSSPPVNSSLIREKKNITARRNATSSSHVAGAIASPQRNSASPTTAPPKGGPSSARGGHAVLGKSPKLSPPSPIRNPRTRPAAAEQDSHDRPHVPDYLSSIHRPSTNPVFPLDTRPGVEFSRGVDMSGSSLRVEIWGRVAGSSIKASLHQDTLKGKGKERAHLINADGKLAEWKILESWDFDLADLIPLPDDLRRNPSLLPYNTLLVTLSPYGQAFYLRSHQFDVHSHSRPSTPLGYGSDPESEVRKLKNVGEIVLPVRAGPSSDSQRTVQSRTSKWKRELQSFTWQDLLKLINLQTCIIDTEQSLSEVVREIDKVVTQDSANQSAREISECTSWIHQLHEETGTVNTSADELRRQIASRREDLRKRREVLALARESHADDDVSAEAERERLIEEEKERLAVVQERLPRMRSALLTTLADIYPIELVSPPDLLFTILDVPLPIPVASTDPAPPPSLRNHKEVTEDAVATALGYAAQVVQLLAAYLGKVLVYPVTCVGSKSLVKDGISAMMGPRMFPLFSKGVDTYRFEYGVFLLNKDIEMLMAERNLRALDMRHTLPNLKNLLLTLTDNESATNFPTRSDTMSSASISSMQSPILMASNLPESAPTSISNTTPQGLVTAVTPFPSIAVDDASPPASGSTTPTASGGEASSQAQARRSRNFLDLAPLTGFLRGRYPSNSGSRMKDASVSPGASPGGGGSAASAKAPASADEAARDTVDVGNDGGGADPQEGSESEPGTGNRDDDDEDERRTIRGGEVREEDSRESKPEAAGNGHAHADVTHVEKVVDGGVHSTGVLVNEI